MNFIKRGGSVNKVHTMVEEDENIHVFFAKNVTRDMDKMNR